MDKKIVLLTATFLMGCSLDFIKKRLPPPHKVNGKILFQYEAPSARKVNLAGNFPDNVLYRTRDERLCCRSKYSHMSICR